jgi:N-acetylglutamate synthase-like GNAT family acetyltransferase
VTTQLTTEGSIIIRSMESKDSGAIIDLYQILSGAGMTIILIDPFTEDVKESLDLSFVAEFNCKIIGFVIARRAYIGAPVVEVCLIQGLIIHPLYHGREIETQLVESLTQRAKSMGIKSMRAILSANDPRMEKFFTRLNFVHAQVAVYDKQL